MSSCLETPASSRRLDEEGEELIDDDEEEEEEEVEDEEEEEVEEEEDEEEGGDHLEVTVGRRSGRGLTLKTLLKERVLEPGEGNMTINYLGNKFKGDLLSDGRIRSQETGKIFGTPSAWAIYCKKIVNPDKKSGCGWASVRYRGKKLDTYKNNWYRQKRLEYEKEEEEMEEEESGCESEEASPQEQEIIEFDVLGSRNPNHDPSTMIELATFQNIGRMQPFNITMSSSAMAVIDVHAHLTTSEVVGYLAGQWDVNNHISPDLIVSHAFPVRCRLGDSEKGVAVEQELYAEMARLKLSLVGWYHTHPSAPPLPSLRDIDSQLDYEMKMKGYNDASYTPVLGIIVSPYQKSPVHDRGIPHPNGNATGFWVMPPPENKPLEYGRPMSMQFTVVQDAFIPKEALLHMSEVVKYYKDAPDVVELTDVFEEKFTYWHKLKNSLRNRVPKDHFQPLIDFLTKVIDKKLPEDDPMPPTPPASTPSSSTTASTSSSSLPPSLTTTHLPPSTSISLVESKVSAMEGLSSTKDLESCVTNLLKATMGADLPSSLSDSSSKEKLDHGTPIVCPSPGLSEDHPSTSRPKSAEGRTPPPKSYSPLFQLPLPPIFSLDSAKLPSKDKPLPHFPTLEDKRMMGDFPTPPKARASPSTKSEEAAGSDGSSKKDASEMSAPGAYLDMVPSATKEGADGRGKKLPLSLEDPKREASKLGSMIDVPAWFAQAKLMQEAFSLPPHERENPYGRAPSPRDVSPLFPPEFLSSHWNPAAALKGFHPSLPFPSDSKPTYHSEVPLLLKKQKQEVCSSSSSSSSPASSSHDHKDIAAKNTSCEEPHREFRPPPDYKEATKELRERGRDVRSFYEEKDFRGDSKVFKEPRDLKGGDSTDTYLKEPREVKMAHCGRDAEDSSRREFWEAKDPLMFDEKDHEEVSRLFRDSKSAKGHRDPLEPMDVMREMKNVASVGRDVKDRREVLDLREVRVSRDGRLLSQRGEGTHPGHGVRDDARDMRKVSMESAEGKGGRSPPHPAQGPLSLSEAGPPPKEPAAATFRPVAPMDMSTFKIKRDLLNPDVRHFIEPTGSKRHPPADPLPLGGAEASRNVMDLSEGREGDRSPKEGAVNLACGAAKDSGSGQREFKELLEAGYVASPARGADPKEGKSHEGREGGGDLKEALLHPKALINLRDPKSLLETRDFRDLKERMEDAVKLERDERPSFPLPPRQLYPSDEEMSGAKDAPTPPLFMSSRRTPSVEEPMDFE